MVKLNKTITIVIMSLFLSNFSISAQSGDIPIQLLKNYGLLVTDEKLKLTGSQDYSKLVGDWHANSSIYQIKPGGEINEIVIDQQHDTITHYYGVENNVLHLFSMKQDFDPMGELYQEVFNVGRTLFGKTNLQLYTEELKPGCKERWANYHLEPSDSELWVVDIYEGGWVMIFSYGAMKFGRLSENVWKKKGIQYYEYDAYQLYITDNWVLSAWHYGNESYGANTMFPRNSSVFKKTSEERGIFGNWKSWANCYPLPHERNQYSLFGNQPLSFQKGVASTGDIKLISETEIQVGNEWDGSKYHYKVINDELLLVNPRKFVRLR